MTSAAGTGMMSQLAALNGAAAGKTPNAEKAREEAREFESVFLSTVLAQMFSTLDEGSGPLGASGAGGETWRSFLTEEYAKEISNAGGVGLADQVMRELIGFQEQTQ